jgi:hypothetical protein
MTTETCLVCNKPATYLRHTQFAGIHPYCEEHAKKESDFNENDSYTFWEDILAGAKIHSDKGYEESTHEKQAEFEAKRNYEWNGVAPSVNQQYKVTCEWDNWKPNDTFV